MASLQREQPVAVHGPTHAHRHKGVGRRCDRRRPEGPLYEVNLPPDCREAGSYSYDCFLATRTHRLDPNPPVRLLRTCPTLGSTSFGLRRREAVVRGYLGSPAWRRKPEGSDGVRSTSGLAYRRARILRAPLSTTTPMIPPMTRSGMRDPVQATNAPAAITPMFARTSLAEKM